MERNGFTLIELVIVFGIIALLSAIVVPVMGDASASSRSARRAADLRSVAAALATYKNTHGSYPTTGGEWKGDSTNDGGLGYGTDGYIPGLVPDLLPALPKDPNPAYPDATHGYRYKSDGTDYKFELHGTPESFPEGNPFVDAARPDSDWQVSTPGAYDW